MRNVVGPTMLGVGTILVSSIFAVLKSLNHVHPIVRASWRLQTMFLALAGPSAISIYVTISQSKQRFSLFPPLATLWSGCGYALYNLGLCVALANTSLLRASILSQCAPLFILLYKNFRNRYCRARQFDRVGGEKHGGVHWKHVLGVVLSLVGTGVFISSTTSLHDHSDSTISENERNQRPAPEVSFRSHVFGDLTATAASIGYAIYISCGQKARRSAPVYIHLPGCVLVATILVSIFSFIVVDVTGSGEKSNVGGETSDFCSNVLGWTCSQYLPRAIYLGVVCGAIAVGLINWSLNRVSALQAAAANSAEPIAASAIGIIFFSEPVPNFVAILAAGIIILAMLLCSADDGTNKKIEEKSDKVVTNSTVKIIDGKRIVLTFSSFQFVFFKGLIVCSLILMECFFVYYSRQHLPEVRTNVP